MISGVLLMPLWWRERPGFAVFKRNFFKLALLSFFQTFLLYSLFYAGISRISGAVTAIIVGSSPLWAAIMSHLFLKSDKLTAGKLVSLLIGVLGVGLIIFGRSGTILGVDSSVPGMLLVLGSCCSSALGNVVVVKYPSELPAVFQNSMQIFMGGLGLFVVSLCFEEGYIGSLQFPEWQFWASLLWLAFISAVAFSLWFWLLRRPGVKVSDLNLWKFIIPVSGAILSWVILPDESPNMSSIFGMAMIALSIVLFNKNSWNRVPRET
jgi:drug/metabolite transporter (DMT)-like permease